MQRLPVFFQWTLLTLIIPSVATADPGIKIQRYGRSFTEAVVVVDDADLAHTHQLLPGEPRLPETEQIKEVFDQLTAAMMACGSSATDLIQVNLYVARPEVSLAAHDYLASWMVSQDCAAVTTVETSLPGGAAFGLDAVFAVGQLKKDPSGKGPSGKGRGGKGRGGKGRGGHRNTGLS